MSPDWSAKAQAVPYASLGNPQSLNLYGYMRNNPLGGTDPDGHCARVNPVASSLDGCDPFKFAEDANEDFIADDQQRAQQQYASVVIKNGQSYETKLCGDHECVAYVKEAGGFSTPTGQWKAGEKVLDDKGLQSGTVIMLADKDGNYPAGSSPKHAAEFVRFTKDGGIEVRDQWAARFDKKTGEQTRPDQPVHTRILHDNQGEGNPIADASRYRVLLIPIRH